MDMLKDLWTERRIKWSVLALIIFVLLIIIFNFLTKGTLKVITDDPNSNISITTLGQNSKTVKTGQGEIKARLSPGKYEIKVASRISATAREIDVKARHAYTYHISLPKIFYPEAVLPASVNGMSSDGSKLIYSDSDSGTLYRLDGVGVPKLLNSTANLISTQWANTDFGVGKSTAGHLFTIINGNLAPMKLPFAYGVDVNIDYSVGKNGTVYVSADKNVYSGQFAQNFKRIYKAKTDEPQLFAGNNSLALIDPVEEYSPEVVTINKGAIHTKTTPASRVVWSPDDSSVLVTGLGLKPRLFNSSLSKMTGQLNTDINDAVWKDNDSLIYAKSNSLWLYDTNDSKAQIIANSPSSQEVTGLYTGFGQKIYFNAQGQDRSEHLYVVGLGTQPSSDASYKSTLGIFFPSGASKCHFTFTNFLRPVIVVDSWNNKITCLDAAREELKADDLPTNLPVRFAEQSAD